MDTAAFDEAGCDEVWNRAMTPSSDTADSQSHFLAQWLLPPTDQRDRANVFSTVSLCSTWCASRLARLAARFSFRLFSGALRAGCPGRFLFDTDNLLSLSMLT